MSDKSLLDNVPIHSKGFPLRDFVQPPVPDKCPKCGKEAMELTTRDPLTGAALRYLSCDCFKQVKSLEELTKSK